MHKPPLAAAGTGLLLAVAPGAPVAGLSAPPRVQPPSRPQSGQTPSIAGRLGAADTLATRRGAHVDQAPRLAFERHAQRLELAPVENLGASRISTDTERPDMSTRNAGEQPTQLPAGPDLAFADADTGDEGP
jgi:hypothetical protein